MKWISIEEKLPRQCDTILFTDGKEVYYGWLESGEDEDPSFYFPAGESTSWPEKVTHWMELPKLPKVDHA